MMGNGFSIFAVPALLFTVLVSSAGDAFAQWGGRGDWHMGPGMMGGYGMMGWMGGIFMLIVWVLVIVGLIYLVKWLIHSTRSESAKSSEGGSKALEILRERYARGEIDKTEFEEKKKDLFSA